MDPHSFNADLEPVIFFNADPDLYPDAEPDPTFKNCGVIFLTDIFVYLKGSNYLTSANNSQLFTEFRLRNNYLFRIL